jgi:hypothetical protein
MRKYGPPVYHPPPDPKDVARWTKKRRREDAVDRLPQGFTFRAHGRYGYVYYLEGGRTLEIPWEMSGLKDKDIIICSGNLKNWALPTDEPIDPEQQKRIERDLQAWLTANNVRATFED